MPGTLGNKGDEAHDKLVRELVDQNDYWLKALSPRFKEMTEDHKLYLGFREDKRKPHESWRSWSWLGDPYRLTTVETNSWLEIMSSLDPPIQCEGVGVEDEWKARGFERYGDYFLRQNKWTATQEMILRRLSIMGWQPIKTGWREIKYKPIMRPSKAQLIAFDEAINAGLKAGLITSPPDQKASAEDWQSWYQDNAAVYPGTPKPLAPAPTETIAYRGPWFFRPSPFELRFDPFVEDLQEHEVFIQRIIKPRSFTELQVQEGKFDPAQVKAAGSGTDEGGRLSKWDRDIADMIGQKADERDPRYTNSDEFLEVWRPQATNDQYLVIMNRSCIVNTSTDHPYWHRQLPYFFIKNVPVSGHPYGLGSYHQLRRAFQDRLTFRDLLLDGLILSVLPVFLKSKNLGMTELQRFLTPGSILEVNDPNGLKRGWESMAGFAELMQVGQMLIGDQTTLSSTGENVAGQAATVGRVSATEASSRLQQALVPHKKKAERLEEEESAALPQMYYNVYQFQPADAPLVPGQPQAPNPRQQAIGEDEQDPFADQQFTRENFAEVLNMNIRFRGATSKLNKELLAQQLKDFLATASQIQSAAGLPVPALAPSETRAIMRRIWDTFGQKGAGQIFTQDGDTAVQQATQAYLLNAQTAPIAVQNQLLQVQQQLQQLQNPQPQPAPPNKVSESLSYKDAPPDVQRQIEQQAGLQPSQVGQVQPQGGNGQPPAQGDPNAQTPA